MIVEGTILLLCGVGLYASAFMTRKALRGARGELSEPSVVLTARARSLGGTPNAAIGLAYYAALALAVAARMAIPALETSVWGVVLWALILAASGAAAMLSLTLACSLLFVTRMPCVYCWTSHIVNWLLVPLVFLSGPSS